MCEEAPQNIITGLKYQKKNKERVNVYLDGEYAFAVIEAVALTLRKGQQLRPTEIAALKDDDLRNKAYNFALRYLGYRPRSRHEVETHLARKEYDPEVVAFALQKLEERNYLDDRAFAAYWVENRNQFRQRGAHALRYELRQKGISDAIIDEVTGELDEQELAWAAVQPKLPGWRRLDQPDFNKKVIGYLNRRGFGYGVAREVCARAWGELED